MSLNRRDALAAGGVGVAATLLGGIVDPVEAAQPAESKRPEKIKTTQQFFNVDHISRVAPSKAGSIIYLGASPAALTVENSIESIMKEIELRRSDRKFIELTVVERPFTNRIKN